MKKRGKKGWWGVVGKKRRKEWIKAWGTFFHSRPPPPLQATMCKVPPISKGGADWWTSLTIDHYGSTVSKGRLKVGPAVSCGSKFCKSVVSFSISYLVNSLEPFLYCQSLVWLPVTRYTLSGSIKHEHSKWPGIYFYLEEAYGARGIALENSPGCQ